MIKIMIMMIVLVIVITMIIIKDGSLHFWDHTNKQHILGHQAHEAAIIGLEYDPVSHTYSFSSFFTFFVFYLLFI